MSGPPALTVGTTEDSAIGDNNFDDDSAFFEEEASLTHPRCYSSDHVEKLEVFAADLNQALKTSFPAGPNPYTAVHVLLLRWTEDNLGVQSEISALRRVFEIRFHFDAEEWQIPSVENPTRALQKKLYDFQDAHQSETELLIVYYGGHAKADPRRGRSIWQANGQPNSPFLNWSSLQPLLETAVPHVLIILDCCFAATAARDTTEGTTKEILAACGRESPTHGVGHRSFTSALIEEMQAFDGGPFTAAMLHSRLVTMRWRLAFTPIYALLSERGGNSITICPFSGGRDSPRPESQLIAELETTECSQDGQTSMTMEDLQSLQTSQEQTVDTRVLLCVSVVQDAIHDVPSWVSWLTTAAPWDVTKVDVQVHSVFKSYSTLIIVSVPTCAWDRLQERPAYRFLGFIRSGDKLQAAKTLTPSITETISSRGKSQLAPHRLPSSLPSPTAIQSEPSAPETAPFGLDEIEMRTPKPNTLQPLSSKHAVGAIIYPTNYLSDRQSKTQSPPTGQVLKRQGTAFVEQPAPRRLRRSSLFSHSGVPTFPSRAALDHEKTPESGIESHQNLQSWSPEDDELLMRARQQGLNWQPIASQYFPGKTANACRKRHARLMETRNSAYNWVDINIDMLSKAYLDLREQIWKILADRVGEKWQNVEAKCMEAGLKTLQTKGQTALQREAFANLGHYFDSDDTSDSRSPSPRWEHNHQDEEDGFDDSAIGTEIPPPRRERSQSHQDEEDDFEDSAIGTEPPSFGPYSVDNPSMVHWHNSVLPGISTPHQQPQTLPSFSAAFGVPSISEMLHDRESKPEHR